MLFRSEQYAVRKVNLEEGATVPEDVHTLIVPGSQNVPDRAKFEIDQYLMKGGRGIFMLDAIRVTSVAEFDQGDDRNGYVLAPWDPTIQIRVSYPKFLTQGGHRVSLKNGVWEPSSGTSPLRSDPVSMVGLRKSIPTCSIPP